VGASPLGPLRTVPAPGAVDVLCCAQSDIFSQRLPDPLIPIYIRLSTRLVPCFVKQGRECLSFHYRLGGFIKSTVINCKVFFTHILPVCSPCNTCRFFNYSMDFDFPFCRIWSAKIDPTSLLKVNHFSIISSNPSHIFGNLGCIAELDLNLQACLA